MDFPAGVQEVELGSSGQRGLKIGRPNGSALISHQGAQILEFQPQGGQPLLWLSEKALYLSGKAIRGGIPLCFPWFGPHPSDRSKPAHGFARNRDWSLQAVTQEQDALRVRYQLQDDDATRALWPHAFLATMEFLLGKELQLEFSVRNTGDTAFTFSFALHSYFPVQNIRQCRVTGLEDTGFIDQLQDNARCPAEHLPLRFERETDRIYTGASGHYGIHDDASGHHIRIEAPDCRSAIVWNPWQDKTARLGDMAPTAWQGMVCVECGNVGPDEIRLEAGESRAFRLRLAGGFTP